MTAPTGIIMPAVLGASRAIRSCAFTVIKQLSCTSRRKVKLRAVATLELRLDRAVKPISCVAEAGHDVSELVQSLVESSDDDRDLFALGRFLDGREALGRRDEADCRDVDRSAIEQVLDRGDERSARGEHGVEHEALPV